MRQDIDARKDEIIELLQNGTPQAYVARFLGCKVATLTTRLEKWGVAHLKNQNRKGIPHPEGRCPAAKYLMKDGPFIKTHTLKLKLLEEGIKPHLCEICLNTLWNSKKIPLELHHKDCDTSNNELENLQLLCPNCHAQQPGNSGAAIKAQSPNR